MFVIILGLIAAASAAPHFPHQHHGFPDHSPGFRSPHFRGDMFDTGSFWSDLATEMKQLDDMLEEFSKQFPSSVSQEGIQGNEYIITITLSGFEESDIVVKAREGLLMVQAVHNIPSGNQRNYLDVRTLPACVNVNGSWTYKQDVLQIVFPVKGRAVTESIPTSTTESIPTSSTDATEFVTSGPATESREEIDRNDNSDTDADVGLGRGDLNSDNELLTNEIPSRNAVEATTYAVDLKDEYEFVPVNFK